MKIIRRAFRWLALWFVPCALLVAVGACASQEESSALVELASIQERSAEAGEAKRRAALEAYHAETLRLSEAVRRNEALRDLALAAAGGAATRPAFSFDDVRAVLERLSSEGAASDAAFAAKYKEFLADESFANLARVAEAVDRWAKGKLADAGRVEKWTGGLK